MTSQRNLIAAVFLMIIFMVTGIVCYAAFTPDKPEIPIRIMFQNKAGKVFYTHSVHAIDYAVDCEECHHLTSEAPEYNCSECHFAKGDAIMLSREDAMHGTCVKCHDEMGAGPVECAQCHSL